jgi:hypothetical protein
MTYKIAFVVIAAAALSGCQIHGHLPNPAPEVEQQSETVVSGSFIVERRGFTPFKVVITEEMMKPRIEGTFVASGARNDIEVSVLEEIEFMNWQNRHQFQAAYESGRVTTARVRAELPPGTYFVVFNNRFSVLTNKSVTADVKLLYDRVL